MRLRGRFTLWFALAALVPIAVAALVTREVLVTNYSNEIERLRATSETTARAAIDNLSQEVATRVKTVARTDEYVSGLLLDYQKSGGNLSPSMRRQIIQRGGATMTLAGLDVLFLVDGADMIIVSPHNRALRDTLSPHLRERTKKIGGEPIFVLEPTIRGDILEDLLVVEAGVTVSEGGFEVTVVGGRFVAQEFVDGLRQSERVDVRIVSDKGAVLTAPAGDWHEFVSSTPIRLPLVGADGKATAWIELAVSDSDLRAVLASVTVASVVLAVAALLITILLGMFVARRMTRDLDELVLGAQAVSLDNFEHRVEVSARDEIGEVADAFNTMMHDLVESKERLIRAERIAAWQEIARRLAHEIKNPLTPIQMSVETMRKTWTKNHPSFDEIFDESTLTILEETGRLKRIVSEFSEFARMPKPNKQPCDLNDIVKSAASLYKGSITLTSKLADGLPAVEADRDQLTQVVLNLLENARDALSSKSGDEAGTIVIQSRLIPGGDAVELSIADNGPGIPDDIKDSIFTPYFTTKVMKGGTGLGLATVHRIVSDHGGKIRVAKSSMGGAEFIIALPTGPAPLALTYRSVPDPL